MKKAIVLGGTTPHVNLIDKLKKRGYYVYLVDYLANPPGAAVADEHLQESTLDAQKVLQIAAKLKVELVISTCIDQANCTCCYVAEQLGLPRPYSYEVSLNVTDKSRMKRIMTENGIPTSPFIVVHSIQDIDWAKVRFPAVVKPVDCNSSKGVHRADSQEDVLRFVGEALELSRSGASVIEEFNCGEEIQVDCLATYHGTQLLLTRQKKRAAASGMLELQSTGSDIPAHLSQDMTRQCEVIAQNIASAFGLQNTPFFFQAIVTAHGISVLEFAPRIGGGLSFYLMEKIAGVDIVSCAIDSFLGIPIRAKQRDNPRFYTSCLLYMTPGTFHHIEGFELLKTEGIILDSFQYIKQGTVIPNGLRSGNRVGAMVIEAENPQELRRKEQIAYRTVRVCDANGNDLLNRTLFK